MGWLVVVVVGVYCWWWWGWWVGLISMYMFCDRRLACVVGSPGMFLSILYLYVGDAVVLVTPLGVVGVRY
ncbi:hypothetical protein BO71DRAFT_404310 [Aspergillus ellipticus CBS 707.79]|uniref:Transmembrane protein n=1 Tax=Aspergillus ellipticus CBS 707.79 TaxID=1448320 RepID=A0A319CTL7_9EURO|nr:hypothetical protein BO71DRAFT_404310 [Aspergillus ellipticus CBS 707.79]